MNLHPKIGAAIEISLSPPGLQFGERVFLFARACICLREEAPEALRPFEGPALSQLVALWRQRAEVVLGQAINQSDLEMVFGESFAKVRTPLGGNPVKQAYERARQVPLPDLPGLSSLLLKQTYALCREMAWASGSLQPFYLSARTAGEVLGSNKNAVHKALSALCGYRYLHQDKRGGLIGGQRMASQYSFHPHEELPTLEPKASIEQPTASSRHEKP